MSSEKQVSSSSISDDDRGIIAGCVKEGIVHELPERLKLNLVLDYDEVEHCAKRKAKIAEVCYYWFRKLIELRFTPYIRPFAKRVIECFIDCYADPLDDGSLLLDDPVAKYLWPAIRVMLKWGYFEMLPSKCIIKCNEDGQKCFELFIHDLFNCFFIDRIHILILALLKKDHTNPKTGWLLQFDFSAKPSEKNPHFINIFQFILKNGHYDSDIVSELLDHGMIISNKDVLDAFHMLSDTEYTTFHRLFSCRLDDPNESWFEKACITLVNKKKFVKHKPNFTAILLSSLSKNDDMANKLIQLASLEVVCPQNLNRLVPSLSSKNCSKLFLHLWKVKHSERCAIVINCASNLDRQIMLKAFEEFTTFILEEQSGLLYKPLITHPSLDLNEVFKVVFKANKLRRNEHYKFALLFVMNNGDIDLLNLAYTQGNGGTAVHGAVELCLKTENETELLSEVCKRRKRKPKVTDSNNSTPYHVIAKLAAVKPHIPKLLEILVFFDFIDPTLKEKNNKKTALMYANSNSQFSHESIKILSDAVSKWKAKKTIHSPLTIKKVSKKDTEPTNESKGGIENSKASNNETQVSQITHFHPKIVECVGNVKSLIKHDTHTSPSSENFVDQPQNVSLEEPAELEYSKNEAITQYNAILPDDMEGYTIPRNGEQKDYSNKVNNGGINQAFKADDVDDKVNGGTDQALEADVDDSNVDLKSLSSKTDSNDQDWQDTTLEELLQQLIDQPSKYFTNADSNSDNKESEDDSISSDGSDGDSDNEIMDSNNFDCQPIDEIQQNMSNYNIIPELNDPEDSDLEDSGFDSLPWEIFLAKQANDFLKSSKTSKRVKNDIIKKMRLIAQGIRSNAICHRLISPQDKLYETKLYRGARIIWCEAIQYSERHSQYCDVVKIIWITLKHSKHQLNNVLQKVKSAWEKSRLVNFTKHLKVVDHSNDPKIKPHYKYTERRFPRMFAPVHHHNETPASIEKLEKLEKLHPLPNLFGGEFSVMQFHPLDDAESYFDALLNNDLSDRDFPICLSEREHEIIKLPYRKEAIILCGRSGTGKTTTCIYRMWNEFQTFWSTHAMDHKEDAIHQTFVTKNPVLCYQVKKEFHKLMKSKQFEQFKSENNQAKPPIGGKLSDYTDKMFPLFMTSRNFLLHLDSSLAGEKFFPRDKQTGELLIQFKFNAFDQYNDDIDPDILDNLEQLQPADNSIGEAEIKEDNKQCAIEINADYFCNEIWPKISSQTLQLSPDPLLIWTEIQSFIKGSREAVKSDKGYLTENEYITLGKRVAPTYDDKDRKTCYEYFEKYTKYVGNFREAKKDVFLFDENDLLFNVYKRIQQHHVVEREEHPLDWYIDSFYIDEIQDFTQAELSVLLGCCRNPNGTFCTGDIAQSIMKGVFFRFEDLRSQFHDLATCSDDARPMERVRVPKQIHSLEENFRSHSGVLDLAQSVVDILKKNFKASFQDSNLPREKAMFKGLKPILLKTTSKDELARILLGNPENTEVPHELGAHQAIIVRSDKARKELPESIRGGLVLTVLEAKGLEFNDVLLYNFFNDSQVKAQWRLLYNDDLCEESPKTKEQLGMAKNLHQLRIDYRQEERLKSLSAELKHLYTAVTRARMNLWIYDEGLQQCELPFYYYCLAKDLVRLVNTSNESSDAENLIFAAPSPSEQWSKQGDYYFKLRKWSLAMTCYKNGNNLQKRFLTEGYKLIDDVVSGKSTQLSADQSLKIIEAARLFLLANKSKRSTECIEKTIKCLKLAGLHNEAGSVLDKMENYDEALNEWIRAKNWKKVVDTKERLNNYSGAIRYIAYEMKDYGTALIKAQEYESSGHSLDDDVKPQQIAYMYIRNKKGKNIEMSEAFRYVSDDNAKATLLRETGRLEEAADHFFKAGHQNQACRILEAQNLFAKACTVTFNDEKIHAKFLLYYATFLAIKSDCKKTEELNQILLQLCKLPFFNFCRGRSLMLAGLIDKNDQLLLQAIENFKRCDCLPGEILAFCRLKHLFPSKKEPGKDLYYSKAAHNVAKAIEAAQSEAASFTFRQKFIYQEVRQFHDLHYDDGEDYYCISSFLLKNNICPTLHYLDHSDHDEDGMVKLDIKKVDEYLITYYFQLSIDFLKSSSDYFSQQLPVKLKTSEFQFVLQFSCIPRKELGLDLNNYFKNIKELLEYSYLTEASFDVCKDVILFQLFSPDVAHYLHITRKNINYFKHNSVVRDTMTGIAMKMLNDPESTLQTYFTAFRLLTAFIGKYEAQGRIMKVMKSHVHNKYIFIQENTGKELHIFNGWIETHNRILRGEITGAVHSAYHFFLKRIANLDDIIKTEAISINTVNYIVSILSTALLNILLQQCGHYNPWALYLVPRYMKAMLLTNFELFCGKSISNACMQQVQKSYQSNQLRIPRLLISSVNQLNILLSFLLGDDGSNYNVLQTALTTECCIKDGSAFYCLMQCLIIASNLYIEAYHQFSQTPEALNKVHAQFLKIHKIIRQSRKMNTMPVKFVSSAIDQLSKARNIKDIFTFVHQILPTQFQNSDLCSASLSDDNMVYESQYPIVPLKSLVIIERPMSNNDQHIQWVVENQVISSDVPSPTEESKEPGFDDEDFNDVELKLADLPEGLVSEDHCNVCDIVLFQGVESSFLDDDKQMGRSNKPEEYRAHLESDGHRARVQEYKEFIEKKDSLKQKLSNLNSNIKALHEINSLLELNKLMIDLEKLKTNEKNVSDDTMKCLISWSDGSTKLKECHQELQKYEKIFSELKDEYEKRTKPMLPPKEDTEVEILLPTESDPPKLNKKSRKQTKQKQAK